MTDLVLWGISVITVGFIVSYLMGGFNCEHCNYYRNKCVERRRRYRKNRAEKMARDQDGMGQNGEGQNNQ